MVGIERTWGRVGGGQMGRGQAVLGSGEPWKNLELGE